MLDSMRSLLTFTFVMLIILCSKCYALISICKHAHSFLAKTSVDSLHAFFIKPADLDIHKVFFHKINLGSA